MICDERWSGVIYPAKEQSGQMGRSIIFVGETTLDSNIKFVDTTEVKHGTGSPIYITSEELKKLRNRGNE